VRNFIPLPFLKMATSQGCFMKNTVKLLVVTALITVTLISMVACPSPTEPKEDTTDPNQITLNMRTPTFSKPSGLIYESADSAATSGVIVCSFMRSDGLTISDLSWVTAGSFSLSLSGPGARTVTINSIEKEQYNYGRVDVILSCTRSAGYVNVGDARTATVSVTAGGGYTLKWSDNKYFTF
jgi:hypothetical protein